MQKLNINGKDYPVYFDLLAIETVCQALGDDDINKVAASLGSANGKMSDVSKAIKLSRACVLAGIEGGYRKIGEACSINEQWLLENVKSVPEILPAVEMFSTAFAGFFTGVTEKK